MTFFIEFYLRPKNKQSRWYLTEAGSEAFDEMYDHRVRMPLAIIGHTDPPVKHRVGQSEMVKDILNVLVGVPSQSFVYDEVRNQVSDQNLN